MAITRSQILHYSSLYMGQISYSQSGLWSDGYRRDCSGYLSRCWQTAKSGSGTWGGYSTVTFVTEGIIVEIPWAELQPGDAIGRCGPGTAGNAGHIMLWLGKEGTRHRVRDHGTGMGPVERLVTPPSDYRAYRFIGVEGFSVDVTDLKPDQFPLQSGHYFGDINGPAHEHGGGVASDIPYVRAIQTRLKELGFDPGIIDGEFGPNTETAVRAFQASRNITVDGDVGPQTWKELFTRVTVPIPETPVPQPTDPENVTTLSRIEAKLDTLLSRVPAQLDIPSLETLTEIKEHLNQDVFVEAVKKAFREGTQ